jgi:Fic family protein
MKTLVQIDALKTEIDSLRPLKPEQEQQILKKFRLDWNYHSNALEGNAVTLGETQIFLEYGLTAKGKPFKDYLDIRGHDEAITYLTDFINRQQPLTEAAIRELHRILLSEPYVVDAITPSGIATQKTVQIGQYKSTANHVRTPTGDIHHYATPEETPAKMGDLMKWYQEERLAGRIHIVEIAARFHHQFVAIHPFDDGNGRMSRLLMNLMLIDAGYPPVIVKSERKNEYLFALRSADQGDLNQFVEFIAEELVRSEELYLRGAKGEPVEEMDDVDKEISLLKQELKHIEEPLELTLATQEEIFNLAIMPFLTRLTSKLSQFDELFSETVVTVNATRIQNANVFGIPGSGAPVKGMPAALERVRIWRAEKSLLQSLDFNIRWNEFKKLPLTTFNHSATLNVTFERLRYSITSQNIATETSVYGQPLPPQVINNFVNRICEVCLARIRTEMKKKHGATG